MGKDRAGVVEMGKDRGGVVRNMVEGRRGWRKKAKLKNTEKRKQGGQKEGENNK